MLGGGGGKILRTYQSSEKQKLADGIPTDGHPVGTRERAYYFQYYTVS